MEITAFDLGQSMADLARFRQATANAAAAMKANFAVHLAALSEVLQETAATATISFDDAFSEINAITGNSSQFIGEALGSATSASISSLGELQAYGDTVYDALQDAALLSANALMESYTSATEIVKNAWTGLQGHGSEQFALLADNATASSSDAKDNIIADKYEIGAALIALQTLGTEQFELFSQNATGSFMATRDSIYIAAGEISDRVTGTADNMEEHLKNSFENIVEAFHDSLDAMRQESIRQFDKIAGRGEHAAGNIAAAFSTSFRESLESLARLKINMATVLGYIYEDFKTTAENAKKAFVDAFNDITEGVSEFGNVTVTVSKETSGWLETVYRVVISLYSVVATLKIAKSALTFITVALSAALSVATLKIIALVAAVAGVLFLVRGAIGFFSSRRRSAADATPDFDIESIRYGGIVPSLDINTFASGGFPRQGHMFIAREAGPELVGSIGARTAVANNDQIVEAVSRGVFDAVRAALAGNFSGTKERPLEVKVYLDGRQITDAVERTQRERGLPLLARGFA